MDDTDSVGTASSPIASSSQSSVVQWTPPPVGCLDSPSSIVHWIPPVANAQASDRSIVSWSEDNSPTLNVSPSPSDDPKVFQTPSRHHSGPAKRLRQQLAATSMKKKIKFASPFLDEKAMRDRALYFPSYLREVPQISSSFNVINVIGRGTFGIIYLGVSKIDSFEYALKYLVPTSSCNNILMKMKMLEILGKHSNVIELLSYVRHLDQVVLIFPFFSHEKFENLLSLLNLDSVYTRQLLSALAYVHSYGIIHRDVKPSNYLFNSQLKIGKLIDFGLAQFYCRPAQKRSYQKPSVYKNQAKECSHPVNSVCTSCMKRKVKRVPRSGTPGYRAPEVLLKYQNQTGAIDIWSCGVMLLSLLSRRYPFFIAIDDMASLAEIIAVFGSETCIHAANEIGISLIISERCNGVSIATLCEQTLCKESSIIVLLSAMLDVNCMSRITAEHALHML